jgi:fused signal recognition particle receptor
MVRGLHKTRMQLGQRIRELLVGQRKLDAVLLDELEGLLLAADFGIETTEQLLKQLQADVARTPLLEGEAVLDLLKRRLVELLDAVALPAAPEVLTLPKVILLVGVNGAGKTTSIGKLAARFQAQGQRVMLAAGDTFRAAAVEQLQRWGEKNQVPVVAQHTGADSASVLYDALSAAKARGFDVLIADTAGRLHTQNHLMDELKKVKRVLQKLDADAPHEVLLVLDASIGQNALSQAREFQRALGVTGIILTKLDGTAKGGIVFAIAHTLAIPVRYLGLGEGIDDLRAFDATQFVEAIFQDD